MKNIFGGGMSMLTAPTFDEDNLHTNLGAVASAILGVSATMFAFKKLKEIIDAPETGKRNLYRFEGLRIKYIKTSKYKKTLKPKYKLTKKKLQKSIKSRKKLKRMGWL